jgi:TRAP-type C4-dicarboxylate transport system permease small subunit
MFTSKWEKKLIASAVEKTAVFGSLMLGVMMLITAADVIGRKFFDMPVKGAYELCEFLLVLVVFLNMPNCEMRGENVTIDMIVEKLKKRTQSVINTICYGLFLMTTFLMTLTLFVYSAQEIGGKVTSVLGLPVFPFIFIAGLGCLLLTVVVAIRTWTYFKGVWEK